MILRDKPALAGSLGGLTLAVGLLLNRFAPDWAWSDFLSGMCIGMSLVFNLFFLWTVGRARREK